jgi:outer membrane biosynthesis protein TonB
MSQIIDQIFNEVCLDSRIPDGIFNLEEESHMDALRDHLVKGGLTLEDATTITNKMVEGKYPERQAYQKDTGITVTWPTPEHKAKAMKENPGKYVEENPNPKSKEPPLEPTPAPKQAPVVKEPEPKSVNQGGQILAIEPPRGPEPEPPPTPPQSPVTSPTTPERRNAEKAVVQQMMATDDTFLASKFYPSIPESCIKQLAILREHAITQGLKEASEFLQKYTNP